MKFGVREICDVVLKAKAPMKLGTRQFFKHEPVMYFDSLKTSSLEGAATTVYAQGGRGNARLVAWEGERTVTFTMEDALISPEGFMILSGAGLIEATNDEKLKVHTTEQTREVVKAEGGVQITLKEKPYTNAEKESEHYIYVMVLDEHGEVTTEPYCVGITAAENVITIPAENNDLEAFSTDCLVLVDYYVEKASKAKQIEISADKFGGNYYLEASTLFRTTNGVDMPAEFIIPNCKIQSNFTFTMASSGDPSTFTFTMDAFPDYTRFGDKKVLAAIQIIEDASGDAEEDRNSTAHKPATQAE